MREQHHSKELLLFTSGATYGINYEFVGIVSKKSYLDSLNFRLTASDNNEMVLKKIRGEDRKFPNIDNRCVPEGTGLPLATSYFCLFAIDVAGHIYEIWVDELKQLPCFFRVDGKIVAMSADIPFTIDFPIQGHKNDSLGGEVFLTDYHVEPHTYSIADLLQNSGVDPNTGLPGFACTEKYFADYNDDLFIDVIKLPVDHPVLYKVAASNPFPALFTTIGAGGQVAGQVQYAIRFKDSTGNPTPLSEPTPMIPIPKQISSADIMFPWEKTEGDSPAQATTTGVAFMFRVTNLVGLASFEIIRFDYKAGAPLGAAASSVQIIHTENIVNGEISIKRFFDLGATGDPFVPEEESDNLAAIKRAKAIRYFDKQLYLMNVEYQSRDVDDEVTFVTSADGLVPAMYKMNQAGHKDPYNATYYRSYMHLEKHGYAVVLIDPYGEQSFAKRMTGSSAMYPLLGNFDNFQMPSRRDTADPYSATNDGLVTAATSDQAGYVADLTFEVFDLADALFRDQCFAFNSTCYKNILDTNETWNGVSGNTAGYHIFHPISDIDPNVDDHRFIINTGAYLNAGVVVNYDDVPGYHPKGFAPNYYSLGLKAAGLDQIPSFASAFKFVRTLPAGRVVCQGLGMYKMNVGQNLPEQPTKDKDMLWFYSPDMEAGLVNINDIINNPQLYEVQVVSALGFFSEIWNYAKNSAIFNHPDYNADFISYARILFEDGTINSGDNVGNIGEAGYVSHRKWRNTFVAANSVWNDATLGDTIMDVVSMAAELTATNNPHERSTIYNLKVSRNVYSNPDSGGDVHFDTFGLRNFHEPVYIINILRKNAAIDPTVNQQTYVNTGHYQKLISIIARQGDYFPTIGQRFEYDLIDERWEDCIPVSGDAATNKYVFVQDIFGNEKRWLNIGEKGAVAIAAIEADLIANGFFFDGVNNIFGVYTHTRIAGDDLNDRFYKLIFDGNVAANLVSFYVPQTGSKIIVKYDNRFPIIFFGGDTWIGESIFSPIDGFQADGGDGDAGFNGHDGQFYFGMGMPYYFMHINLNYFIANKTTGLNKLQDDHTAVLQFIRQWTMMFTCSSRISVPMMFFGDCGFQYFPQINYVMRPHAWDPSQDLASQNVFDGVDQYGDNYPCEIDDDVSRKPTNWIYGGFYFWQTFENSNIDYSEWDTSRLNVSVPIVGFVEQTLFCTRAVWSAVREINEQNSPNLKTFPADNYRDLDDWTGCIKKAWDAYSGAGHNLYAFTENGVVMLLTNKFIARQTTGDQLGILQSDQGSLNIMEENWISTENGMPQELWRSFSDKDNVGYWCNLKSMFRIENDTIMDIGKKYYHSRIYQDFLKDIRPFYRDHVTAHHDYLHNEYWLLLSQKVHPLTELSGDRLEIATIDDLYPDAIYSIDIESITQVNLPFHEIALAAGLGAIYFINNTSHDVDIYDQQNTTVVLTLASGELAKAQPIQDVIAWSVFLIQALPVLKNFLFVFLDGDELPDKLQEWVGRFDYRFDKFVAVNNRSYGMRNAETYELEKGFIINGENIAAELLQSSVGDNQSETKEFWKHRVNTNKKTPTTIEYFDNLDQQRNGLVQSSLTAVQLRNYGGGFESFIPRRTAAPNDRMQGTAIIFVVKHNLPEDYYIVSQEIFYKPFK